MTELDIAQSCISKRSIVDMGDSVIYASPDGLVRVSSSGSSVVTDAILRREDWQGDYNPTTIRAYRWEDRYVGFHDASGTNNGFVLDPRGRENAFTRMTATGIAGFNDLEDDTLYVVTSSGVLEKFSASTSSYYGIKWYSKHFFTAKPINLGVCQVSFGDDLSGGNVSIQLFGGVNSPDTSIHSELIADTNDIFTFRLPSGTKYNVFQLYINSNREVSQVIIAESPQELR